jgi:hypothetical protein
MKNQIKNYVNMLRDAIPIIMGIWAAILITWLTIRVTNVEIITIDSGITKILLGLIFTLVTPLIRHLINKRKEEKETQNNSCDIE